ncbi:MAG: aromatic acid exporter family protein [Mycobacteriales bacterium]
MWLDVLGRSRGLIRRGRPPGLRTAKTTLAAVLSFLAASHLHTSPAPVLAPLTALLVVQLTLYETVAHGIGRIVSVVLGVLLSIGIAASVGLTWWSIGAVVATSLVVGRLLRLGAHLLEVPITAMIVLAAVGGAHQVALGRVYETLIGAGVGVAINFVLAPPLYLQPAADALHELSEAMASFLRGLAADLRGDWSRAAAERWLVAARALGAEVRRADRALARAEESAHFNPRRSTARIAQPRLRVGLTGLEHAYVSLRSLCRSLLDRTFFVPVDQESTGAYPLEARSTLAALLDIAADALGRVGAVTAPENAATAPDSPRLIEARRLVEVELAELHSHRDHLAVLLAVDPGDDQGAWQQHGALLAAVDRLRVEVEAAIQPAEGVWRPPPVAERQRRALKRITEDRPVRRRSVGSGEPPVGSPP